MSLTMADMTADQLADELFESCILDELYDLNCSEADLDVVARHIRYNLLARLTEEIEGDI